MSFSWGNIWAENPENIGTVFMVNFLSKLSKEKSLPYPKYKGTSGVIFHRVNYRMT